MIIYIKKFYVIFVEKKKVWIFWTEFAHPGGGCHKSFKMAILGEKSVEQPKVWVLESTRDR